MFSKYKHIFLNIKDYIFCNGRLFLHISVINHWWYYNNYINNKFEILSKIFVQYETTSFWLKVALFLYIFDFFFEWLILWFLEYFWSRFFSVLNSSFIWAHLGECRKRKIIFLSSLFIISIDNFDLHQPQLSISILALRRSILYTFSSHICSFSINSMNV